MNPLSMVKRFMLQMRNKFGVFDYVHLKKSLPLNIYSKSIKFAIAGALGGLIGEIISEFMVIGVQTDFWDMAFRAGAWSSFLSVFICTFLIGAQNYYLKRPLVEWEKYGKTISIGFLGGFIGGFVAQILFNVAWFYLGILLFLSIIFLMKNIGKKVNGFQIYAFASIGFIFCFFFLRGSAWGLMGSAIGLAASYIVPNLKKQASIFGGLIGGLIGSVFFISLAYLFGDSTGRVLGATSIGFFIGLMIAISETTFREAWIQVIWSDLESMNVGLGNQPVTIGSLPNSTIFLPKKLGFEGNVGAIILENGKIQYEDAKSKKRTDFKNGSQITIGNIIIKVHAG